MASMVLCYRRELDIQYGLHLVSMVGFCIEACSSEGSYVSLVHETVLKKFSGSTGPQRMSANTWQRYCRSFTSNWFRPCRLNVGMPYSLGLEENLVAVILPCCCSDVHAMILDLFITVLVQYLELHTCSISF